MAHRRRQTPSRTVEVAMNEAIEEVRHGLETLNNLQKHGLIKFSGLNLAFEAEPVTSHLPCCAHCHEPLRSEQDADEHRCGATAAVVAEDPGYAVRCHCGKTLYSKEAADEHSAQTGH